MEYLIFSEESYGVSVSITFPLDAVILNQLLLIVQFSIVNVISSKRHFPSCARDLLTAFPPCFLPCLLIFSCPSSFAGEKGASSWLSSTLSLECHGFALQKGDFCDVIALRYGWSPQNLPSNCVFGKSNTIEHALSCPNGAFPTIRHNDIRDLMAELMSEVCHDVSKEPSLQSESLSLHTCNLDNGAWLDIKASSFWVVNSNLLFRCPHI